MEIVNYPADKNDAKPDSLFLLFYFIVFHLKSTFHIHEICNKSYIAPIEQYTYLMVSINLYPPIGSYLSIRKSKKAAEAAFGVSG